MLVRIVKMTFLKENIASFEQIFEHHKHRIRKSEGCTHLTLYQDKNDASIFFTYSHWKNEDALEKYRNSDFFKTVWGQTKILFSHKPEAWSLQNITNLN